MKSLIKDLTKPKTDALFYPAVCSSNDGMYFITNQLYANDTEARKDIGGCFVRIAIEYPPLKLSGGRPRAKEGLND